MITFIIGGLALWIIGGFIWFLNNIGNKNGPEPWYTCIILLPLIIITAPLVPFIYLNEKYFDWKYRNNKLN